MINNYDTSAVVQETREILSAFSIFNVQNKINSYNIFLPTKEQLLSCALKDINNSILKNDVNKICNLITLGIILPLWCKEPFQWPLSVDNTDNKNIANIVRIIYNEYFDHPLNMQSPHKSSLNCIKKIYKDKECIRSLFKLAMPYKDSAYELTILNLYLKNKELFHNALLDISVQKEMFNFLFYLNLQSGFTKSDMLTIMLLNDLQLCFSENFIKNNIGFFLKHVQDKSDNEIPLSQLILFYQNFNDFVSSFQREILYKSEESTKKFQQFAVFYHKISRISKYSNATLCNNDVQAILDSIKNKIDKSNLPINFRQNCNLSIKNKISSNFNVYDLILSLSCNLALCTICFLPTYFYIPFLYKISLIYHILFIGITNITYCLYDQFILYTNCNEVISDLICTTHNEIAPKLNSPKNINNIFLDKHVVKLINQYYLTSNKKYITKIDTILKNHYINYSCNSVSTLLTLSAYLIQIIQRNINLNNPLYINFSNKNIILKCKNRFLDTYKYDDNKFTQKCIYEWIIKMDSIKPFVNKYEVDTRSVTNTNTFYNNSLKNNSIIADPVLLQFVLKIIKLYKFHYINDISYDYKVFNDCLEIDDCQENKDIIYKKFISYCLCQKRGNHDNENFNLLVNDIKSICKNMIKNSDPIQNYSSCLDDDNMYGNISEYDLTTEEEQNYSNDGNNNSYQICHDVEINNIPMSRISA